MSDAPEASRGKRGEVITFYSYKGGTGRSMALANVACLLAAEAPRGVLMIDWDFEAPGLHRFFRDRFQGRLRGKKGEDLDRALDAPVGLLELLGELERRLPAGENAGESITADEDLAKRILDDIDRNEFVLATDIPRLSLIKAGSFVPGYSERVNAFPWKTFFERCPPLLPALLDRFAHEFDYVLIDSRTGLTDVSGICTMVLPEKLVLVFTPNRQSLYGLLDLVPRAVSYRMETDVRPLSIFPLPSRIELSENDRREAWRLGSAETTGYQPSWERLLADTYGLAECRLGKYFDDVGIQHLPRFAYGEELAVIVERTSDNQSLTASYKRFLSWLKQPTLVKAAPASQGAPAADDVLKRAEQAFSKLTKDEQAAARSLLLRFVRSPRVGERAKVTALDVPVVDVDERYSSLARSLTDAGVITRSGDVLRLSDERLLRWTRLEEWRADDVPFLTWRQELSLSRDTWKRSGEHREGLLGRPAVTRGRKYLRDRSLDLSARERDYLEKSIKRDTQLMLSQGGGVAIVLSVVVVLVVRAFLTGPPVLSSNAVRTINERLEGPYASRSADGELTSSFPNIAACEAAVKAKPGLTCAQRVTPVHCTADDPPRCFDNEALCKNTKRDCVAVPLSVSTSFDACLERDLATKAGLAIDRIAALRPVFAVTGPGDDEGAKLLGDALKDAKIRPIVDACAVLHGSKVPVFATVRVNDAANRPLSGVRVVEDRLFSACETQANGTCSLIVRADPKGAAYQLLFQRPPYVLVGTDASSKEFTREELAGGAVATMTLPRPVTLLPKRGAALTTNASISVNPDYGGEVLSQKCVDEQKTGDACEKASTVVGEPTAFYVQPSLVAGARLELEYTFLPSAKVTCRVSVVLDADLKGEFDVSPDCGRKPVVLDAGVAASAAPKCASTVVTSLREYLTGTQGVTFEVVAEVGDDGVVKRATPANVAARLVGRTVGGKRCIATFKFVPDRPSPMQFSPPPTPAP